MSSALSTGPPRKSWNELSGEARKGCSTCSSASLPAAEWYDTPVWTAARTASASGPSAKNGSAEKTRASAVTPAPAAAGQAAGAVETRLEGEASEKRGGGPGAGSR